MRPEAAPGAGPGPPAERPAAFRPVIGVTWLSQRDPRRRCPGAPPWRGGAGRRAGGRTSSRPSSRDMLRLAAPAPARRRAGGPGPAPPCQPRRADDDWQRPSPSTASGGGGSGASGGVIGTRGAPSGMCGPCLRCPCRPWPHRRAPTAQPSAAGGPAPRSSEQAEHRWAGRRGEKRSSSGMGGVGRLPTTPSAPLDCPSPHPAAPAPACTPPPMVAW